MKNDHVYFALTMDKSNNFEVIGNTAHFCRQSAMDVAAKAFVAYACEMDFSEEFIAECLEELMMNGFVGAENEHGDSELFMVAEV